MKREVESDSDCEFFLLKELLMNPLRHSLVPQHTVLSAQEVERMEEEQCILPEQWPILRTDDIVCRWLHLRPGQVVQIRRRGLAFEEGNYFRRVC